VIGRSVRAAIGSVQAHQVARVQDGGGWRLSSLGDEMRDPFARVGRWLWRVSRWLAKTNPHRRRQRHELEARGFAGDLLVRVATSLRNAPRRRTSSSIGWWRARYRIGSRRR
jgi:hypothetical protein